MDAANERAQARVTNSTQPISSHTFFLSIFLVNHGWDGTTPVNGHATYKSSHVMATNSITKPADDNQELLYDRQVHLSDERTRKNACFIYNFVFC